MTHIPPSPSGKARQGKKILKRNGDAGDDEGMCKNVLFTKIYKILNEQFDTIMEEVAKKRGAEKATNIEALLPKKQAGSRKR